ncbi:MAG: Hpt domain-containing protein, partial [Gammaproteobacteria bacterium]|nr:Hpt domain-containing protein [Gammaproteobacteria bacterium]
MAITSNVDLGTLGWVKTEIDESLRQARQALESYADNPDDESQLRFCSTHLHQVVGTLEMVQLDGAAMLAQETERLIEAILDESVQVEDRIFEVLTRGILTLPDYLSRLQVGQPDVPLRLLPMVNELRSARSVEPLPEIEFFNPDLSVRPPREEGEKQNLSDDEYREMAKKLRPKFQTALLTWLRDTASKDAMDNMAVVLEQLKSEANLGVIQQLFWVASGLLEAMLSGDLEATNDRKKLFSRLDQQIKRLIDGAGKTDLRNSAEDLVKNILFQLGNAKAANPKVAQLKQAFDLDLLLGHVASEPELQDLPTPEVIESVSSALAREIGDAQDLLAGYFDPEQDDIKTLAPLVQLLAKMAKTMEMLGTPLLKSLTDELSVVCVAIDDKKLQETDAISMIMARALLLIENSSRDISRSATDWKRQIEDAVRQLHNLVSEEEAGAEGIEVSGGDLTGADFRQLLGVVADEVRQSLTTVEDEFETFASDPTQKDRLDIMLEYLAQVEGALQIIDQEGASNLVRRTSEYINDIKAGDLAVTETVLDALAVCIGTIGAYIDGLLYNRPNLDALLDMAIKEIEFAATGSQSSSAPAASESAKVSAPQQLPESEDTGELSVNDAGAVQEMPAEIVDESEDEAVELAPPPSAEEPSSGDEDFDEEIMEIFIEDARDSIDTITKNLPLWRSDVTNNDALLEIRRGFHTIKGSGRMVGASEIAELAWAYESMLNKVRDNKLTPNDAMVSVVAEVMEVMPGMVVQLEGGPAVSADIEGLRVRAHDIADGKITADAALSGVAAPSNAQKEQTATTQESKPVAEVAGGVTDTAGDDTITMDPALLEIFTGETEGHISTIREHVATCQETGSCFATPDLIRATHTLAGSARSVGLAPMS